MLIFLSVHSFITIIMMVYLLTSKLMQVQPEHNIYLLFFPEFALILYPSLCYSHAITYYFCYII